MIIETFRFGKIEIDPETLLSLPEGPIGMSDVKRFCLLEVAPASPMRWLQAVDEPALAFVVVNPYDFYPDYEFELGTKDVEQLSLEKPEDAAVLVLLTITSEQVTANLVAPIIVNTQSRVARQVILQDERYTTKHFLAAVNLPQPAVARSG